MGFVFICRHSFMIPKRRVDMASKLYVLSWPLVLIILFSSGIRISKSTRVFTIVNNCDETIWPAITAGPGFGGAGYTLKSGQSVVVTIPIGWNGRIWGRTGCSFSPNGTGKCQTGSCRDVYKCTFSGETPATLAEFTLADKDFYDVSLVDGFNLPVIVQPIKGTGNCSIAGCEGDLRSTCPDELSVRTKVKTIGCRSACDVFNTDEYCCRGIYGNSAVCRATYYSTKFKTACPMAYTYAYDDPTSLFTCTTNAYAIAFCKPRKGRVCTYYDKNLVCSGTQGLKALTRNWWALMVIPLLSVINLWIYS